MRFLRPGLACICSAAGGLILGCNPASVPETVAATPAASTTNGQAATPQKISGPSDRFRNRSRSNSAPTP